MAQPAAAQDAAPPVIDRIQVLLLYEDTGKLSEDLANAADDTIIANSEAGSGIQVLVNVALKAKANNYYENSPTLHVRATPSVLFDGGPKVIEDQFFLSFIGSTGEIFRSVLVNHGCNDFTIEAWVMDGGKRTSEVRKSYAVLCGD